MEQKYSKYKPLSTIFFFLIGMVLSASLVGAFSHPDAFQERISSEGGVKISAQYVLPEADQAVGTTFRLNLNTHYVDLSSYDFKSLSFLSIDDEPLQEATSWTASGSNHHIQGVLSFAGQQLKGSKRVLLIIKGVGKSEDRIFEWKAPID